MPIPRLACLRNFLRCMTWLAPTVQELEHVHGVGKAGAARIKAALELGRRLLQASPDERFQIRSPADAATLLMPEMSLAGAGTFESRSCSTPAIASSRP